MRLVWPLLAITADIAHADSWVEFAAGVPQRPRQDLALRCELEVELRGAIVEVELRDYLAPGAQALGAAFELALPGGAKLIGLAAQRDHGGQETAISVTSPAPVERVSSADVLGADPVIVTAAGANHYRVVVQPIEPHHELVVTTRWTTLASIHGGALHVTLAGHEGATCRGTIKAAMGPGVSIEGFRIADASVGDRQSAPFVLDRGELEIAADLAFKSTQPIGWTQQESLGDGYIAQALTVITPPVRGLAAKRVLFVIDGSRSMELVGRHHVKRLVAQIGKALPKGTEIEAILFDRTASRVFGEWRVVDASRVDTIAQAIDTHTAGNGSDVAGALTLARQAIGDGQAVVALITDGVVHEAPLVPPSAARPGVDVHPIVLAPGRMRSPTSESLRALVAAYGGSYTELGVDAIDRARVDEWLHPAFRDLVAPKPFTVPELPPGGGVVLTRVTRQVGKLAVTDKRKALAVAAAPAAMIGHLALAADLELPNEQRAKLWTRHPSVDELHALAVLTTTGKIAKSRRTMIAAGGPYLRVVAVPDPTFPPVPHTGGASTTGGSAIDRDALKLLFRVHLQPAAFACYQHALALHPTLAGTVTFHLEIGRGEVTYASVEGLGDASFDACLLDAAYRVTPALPNPDYNVDDRTLANYPLTFSVRHDQPIVVPGDADSTSPLDIGAIQGGVPKVIKAGDTSTPLGNLRPTR